MSIGTVDIARTELQTGTEAPVFGLISTASVSVSGSHAEGRLAESDARKVRSLKQSSTTESAARAALLGILLARMEGATFAETAVMLHASENKLLGYMHGVEQIPERTTQRWETLGEALRNLHRVLKPEATGRWLNTSIPALNGLTPLEAWRRGRTGQVLAVTQGYLDPSFS